MSRAKQVKVDLLGEIKDPVYPILKIAKTFPGSIYLPILLTNYGKTLP